MITRLIAHPSWHWSWSRLESPRRVAAPFMPAQILPTAHQYRLAREEEERSEFRRGGLEGRPCITVDTLPFVCEYDGTNRYQCSGWAGLSEEAALCAGNNTYQTQWRMQQ